MVRAQGTFMLSASRQMKCQANQLVPQHRGCHPEPARLAGIGQSKRKILEAIVAKTASWRRPDSPIGRKGPRKANPKYKRRSGEPWSTSEVKELKSLARANTPTGVLSLKLQRPPAAIRSKAQREGISLRPANRSPYNRRRAG